MITTYYTTKSGSVYAVRVIGEATEVARLTLGDKHHTSAAQVTKRVNDSVGLGVWHPCLSVVTSGVGDILRIIFGPEDALYTNRVTSVEHCEQTAQ